MASAKWEGLTPIACRDFTNWINEAKQDETRARRIARCSENLVAGKRRPCCYAVVPLDLSRVLGDNPAAKAKWSELTAADKREFSEWVEDSDGKIERKARVSETCALLLAGKRSP